MNQKSYDRTRASRLVPLLRSISREITERAQAVRILEGRLRAMARSSSVKSDEQINTEAQLASERRELRLAIRELSRLGCTIDEEHPFRILIPGEDGELAHGFSWLVGSTRIASVHADSLA